MIKVNKRTAGALLIVALLIAAAVVCRFLGNSGYFPAAMGLLRSFIYLGLFSFWGVYVRQRVIQVQARRFLTAIALIIIFWLAVRTVKFFFVFDPDAARQLWYLYYLPMLFHPAAGGIRGHVPGQAGWLSPARMDGVALCSHRSLAPAGADE